MKAHGQQSFQNTPQQAITAGGATSFAPAKATRQPETGNAAGEGWLAHVHYARGAAIFAILLAHTADIFSFPHDSIGGKIAELTVDVTGFFLLLSGYLFQHLSARFDYGDFLRKKLQNVMLPYLFISIPAIAIYLSHLKSHPWLPDSFFSLPATTIVSYFLVTGAHLGPLWFMPVIALFFLAAPIFLWIDRKPVRYLIIIPALILSIYIGRPPHNADPLQSFAHFAFAYLIGMAASRFGNVWMPIAKRHALALLAVGVATTALTLADSAVPLNADLVLKIPLFFAVMALFLRAPSLRSAWLDRAAALSFGLYFVHGYIVGALRFILSQSPSAPHNLIALTIAYAIVVGLAFGIVEVLKAMLGRDSRKFIGA
ncbi:MAG: acyltransferase [Caulobacterales bacterium]